MITIIDYGNTNANELAEFLKGISNDVIVSDAEADILKAGKLILPDSSEIPHSVKALHLLNLFSVLRMIKKPILGIGTGMDLMTESFKDLNLTCLGCFPVKCVKTDDEALSKGTFLKIDIIKESFLLKDVNATDEFYFQNPCIIPVNEFTTAVVRNSVEFSAAMEKNHLFGIMFDPVKSGESGIKVLEKFVEQD